MRQRDLNSFGVGLWALPGALAAGGADAILRRAFGNTLDGSVQLAPALGGVGEDRVLASGLAYAGRVIPGLRPHEMAELFAEAEEQLRAALMRPHGALLAMWPPLPLLKADALAVRGVFGGVTPQGLAVLHATIVEIVPLHQFLRHLQSQDLPDGMLFGQEIEVAACAVERAFSEAYRGGACPAWRSEQVAKSLETGVDAVARAAARPRI